MQILNLLILLSNFQDFVHLGILRFHFIKQDFVQGAKRKMLSID